MHRNNRGAGVIIVICLFLLVLLTSIAVIVQQNKSKNVERAVSVEYNMRTYYAAYAGITECIANRMAPASNLLISKQGVSDDYLKKFNRVQNSGYIYDDPYSPSKDTILSSYSYVSYLLKKDLNGKYSIDNSGAGGEGERFLVYSKGASILPDGSEDVVYIKAVFDLNRFDSDVFNVDEMESFEVIPVSSPEADEANLLIKKSASDNTPPMVKQVSVTNLDGSEVSKEFSDETDKLIIKDVGVRSKINLLFTEPIDPNFIDDIELNKVEKKETPVKNLDKIVISPKNVELLILPAEEKSGQILDYGSMYKLKISGICDYNGNQLQEGPEVTLITEGFSTVGTENTNSSLGGTTSEAGTSIESLQTEKNPFGSLNTTSVNSNNTQTNASGVSVSTSDSVDLSGFSAP
ncbi:MAG: hypothetical protein AB7V50_00785 [Vampirovibrionia bacterium]